MVDVAYTNFLKRKLVEWYAAAPNTDSHAPAQEKNDGEVSEEGEVGEGRARGHGEDSADRVSEMPSID